MTTLDEFLKALNEINDYCETKQHKEGERYCCCDDCILTKICLDIPTRSLFEASVRAAKEALEAIKKSKGTVSEVRDPIVYGNNVEAAVIDEFMFAKEAKNGEL